MKNNRVNQLLIILAVVITITINALSETLPINGLGTGQISDNFKVFFVPAGYVFSIWGVIYLGLIAYAVYQAMNAQRENSRLQGITGWFLLSSLANCVWIFLWHYELFVWTLAAMITLLVSLIMIYLKLGIGRQKAGKAETWLVRIPFSIYLGWITVATIANVTDVLNFVKWSGWGIAPQSWAVIMLVVAVVVAALMTFTRRDRAYLLVLVWAFTGIAVKFPNVTLVNIAAWCASAAVVLLLLLTLILKTPEKQIPVA
jgi:hypothetical protein